MSAQSKKDFLDGVSRPINPKLMDIFMKIHKSESSGKGVNTIKKKYGEDAFIINSESFNVCLPFNELALEDNVPQDVLQQSEIVNQQKCFRKIIVNQQIKNIFYNLILLVVDFISGMTDSFALKASKLFLERVFV